MRTAFIRQLIEEARRDTSIFLLTGDLGFSVLEPFAEEFPDRFLNVGVAEQNMTGIASGLAMDGWNVFTYSIANFPTLRCIEQIRYDVCYHNLNVKIVSVGAGYAYASLGASHHATEDIAMMRSIPNISVASPADPLEALQITSLFARHIGPCYLRLGKAGEPEVHDKGLILEYGKGIQVKKGNHTAVITTGAMLKYAKETIELNQQNVGLYSFPFVKPIDKELLAEISNEYREIIVIEEHQLNGGFSSAVLEAISDLFEAGKIYHFPRIKRVGIPDKFVSVAGSQDYLRSVSGLNFLGC
jgi:transketolase